MTNENLRSLARERWGKCTAFRVGIVAGELNLAIVNPYRGNQASLYRQGLRRGRARLSGPVERNDSVALGWGGEG